MEQDSGLNTSLITLIINQCGLTAATITVSFKWTTQHIKYSKMFEPIDPSAFGSSCIALLKKLKSQNKLLKISLGMISMFTLVLFIRNLKRKNNKPLLPQMKQEFVDDESTD